MVHVQLFIAMVHVQLFITMVHVHLFIVCYCTTDGMLAKSTWSGFVCIFASFFIVKNGSCSSVHKIGSCHLFIVCYCTTDGMSAKSTWSGFVCIFASFLFDFVSIHLLKNLSTRFPRSGVLWTQK